MTVGRICNREVVIVPRSASAPEAARLMREHHVGDLVVIEERNRKTFPVGILTDRDIVVEVLAKGIAPDEITVSDIMSTELITARESDNLLDTIKIMRARGVRRLPVVSTEGALVGIVSVDDLLDLFAEQLTDLTRLISREQTREHERRR